MLSAPRVVGTRRTVSPSERICVSMSVQCRGSRSSQGLRSHFGFRQRKTTSPAMRPVTAASMLPNRAAASRCGCSVTCHGVWRGVRRCHVCERQGTFVPKLPRDQPSSPVLPSGWEQRTDAQGRAYFLDHNTQNSTWTDPRNALDRFAECGCCLQRVPAGCWLFHRSSGAVLPVFRPFFVSPMVSAYLRSLSPVYRERG